MITPEARAYLIAHDFAAIDETAGTASRPATGHHVDFSTARWRMHGGGDNDHLELNSIVNVQSGGFDDFFLAMELVPHGWARARLEALEPGAWIDPHLRYRRERNPTMLVRGRFAGSPHRIVSARRRARAASLADQSFSGVVADLAADFAAAGLPEEALRYAKIRVESYFVALLSNVRDPELRAALAGDIPLRSLLPALGTIDRLRLWEGLGWSPFGAPNAKDIAAAEAKLGFALPEDYRALFSAYRGGTIRGAGGVVELRSVDEVVELTADRAHAIPGAVFFGSNGGGRLYFFDATGRFQSGKSAVFAVDDGVLTDSGCVLVADSFAALVNRVLDGERLEPSDAPERARIIAPIAPWPDGLASIWQWIPNAPAATHAFDLCESIGFGFADAWRELWTKFDGGRLHVDDVRTTFWCLRDIAVLAADPEWRNLFPDLLPFGGNGGERILFVDPRDALGHGSWSIFVVDQAAPFDPPRFVAASLEELCAQLGAGRAP